MQSLGGETADDQDREQEWRDRGEIGEELHGEIIAWCVVTRGESRRRKKGEDGGRRGMSWNESLAEDRNGGTKHPGMFRVCAEKKKSEREKKSLG